MSQTHTRTRSRGERIGFACAYTPLALIHAAGFVPFRILPLGAAPDQAGSLLHDNLCPHVKRILDRALAGDLPELSGIVLMNSCDAMRRLADAWRTARPADRVFLVDLPTERSEASTAFFAKELGRLAGELADRSGSAVTDEAIVESASLYDELTLSLARLAGRAARGSLPGGWKALQELRNRSVTAPIEDCLAELRRIESEPEPASRPSRAARVFLFGNVLPDPEAFGLFEACGAELVADDLCTGSRQLAVLKVENGEPALPRIAAAILGRPACARTVAPGHPGSFAAEVVAEARACSARGAIAHVMKFCDPYLARMPAVRQAMREAGLPLLVLEGDATLRSLGQHRTRIEAFVEMLGGSAS